MIDMAKFGETNLRNVSLRQLLISGDGKNQNFDRQDLRGVNLKDANLTDASFIDTDLSQANLQETTLLRTKLVQTNLDKADLRNANLTGAYIEDWGITRNTIFEGVKGDYVYQKLPTKENRDPNRIPPSNPNPKKDKFGENDLYIFITSVMDTLDLYHRQNINAVVAITVLKGLTEDYPVKFELAAIDKRGESQYVMKLKVFGQASHFQLKREYFDRYEQTLILDDPNQKLIPDNEKLFAKIIKTLKENPSVNIENLHNQGMVIMEGKFVDMSRKIEVNNGNYNEEIKGNIYNTENAGIVHNEGEIKDNTKVAGIINEAEQKNLAEAAAEVQQLLEQLSQNYPITTSKEKNKNIVVGEAVDLIENNPRLKTRVINALKAGGIEAFKQAINHPLVDILMATIKEWQDEK